MSFRHDSADRCAADARCATCSDEGVPMRVVESRAADGLANCVDANGRGWEIQIELVGPVAAGDELLVHAGVALARLDRPGES